MSLIKLFLGLSCAAGTLILMWQIARLASRYMMQQQSVPPGLALLRPAPEAVDLLMATRDGGQLRVWHRGSGPVVVIVPDSGLAASAYTPLWNLLCGYGYRVVSYEPRVVAPRSRDVSELLEDLEGVMRHLRVKHPLLLGHGFGSYVSLLHQARAEAMGFVQAKQIVSVCGYAGGGMVPRHSFLRQIFHRYDGYARRLSAFGEGASTPALEALRQHERGHLGDCLQQAWPMLEQEAPLHHLEVPVSIMASFQDEVMPALHAQRLHELLPDSTLHWSPRGAGHMLIWERPGEVVDLVRGAARGVAAAG